MIGDKSRKSTAEDQERLVKVWINDKACKSINITATTTPAHIRALCAEQLRIAPVLQPFFVITAVHSADKEQRRDVLDDNSRLQEMQQHYRDRVGAEWGSSSTCGFAY